MEYRALIPADPIDTVMTHDWETNTHDTREALEEELIPWRAFKRRGPLVKVFQRESPTDEWKEVIDG